VSRKRDSDMFSIDHHSGLVGSVQNATLWLIAPFSGRFVDVLGPRIVIGSAAIICSLSLMLLSISRTIWQIYLTQGPLSSTETLNSKGTIAHLSL
jgi:MFS family permease